MTSTSIQIVELLIQQESVITELHTQTADELRDIRKFITSFADDLDTRIVKFSTRAENAAAARDYLAKILAQLKAQLADPVQ